MNKKERVEAALRGDVVDRVPVSIWGHDYQREGSAQELAEATLENYTRYDWDYVKVTPRSSYIVEGWKARYTPSDEKHLPPKLSATPIRSSSDWKRLRPLEPDQGALGEQLLALQLINHALGFESYFVETVFCPLAVAQLLVGSNEAVLQTIREDRNAMHTALRIIAETITTFAIACLEQGAHGIYYAINGWASANQLTEDQYREFGEQYDLEILDALKSRSKCTVLHNSGEHIHFDLLASYPIHVINWASEGKGNPDLRNGMRRSGKAVMGGLSTVALQRGGTASQVQDEVGNALEATGGRHLLLAPGNSVAPDVSVKCLNALRRALS
ncbi:uroporphyrinogen decarboxylase family protein [Ktedonospora formicarum]|uniref:Uroporphyrinogen decarboxylase (URO-D) domain-containing protein n=1 Tax=Ktedonospora formicarum TaxID=2778364 RepID=A0A8J3HU90_9CHLR|nr:uroporphyrinogen decarboxylase family protein [Ktedonospora formicarum]GHO44102.1 hypothetical protein KSX_22650 [Ktedonospora formicarum]